MASLFGRRRRKVEDVNDTEPMDTDEQMEMINQLKEDNNRANKFFRIGFAVLTVIFGLIKVFLAGIQFLHPYSMPFHEALKGRVSSPIVITLEVLAAVCFFALALYIRPNGNPRVWRLAAISMALPTLFVTGAVFVYPLETWLLKGIFALWFIGVPLFLTGAFRYLHTKIQESEVAIDKLYKLTYPYKKA